MCLMAFAWKQGVHPLTLIGNRDEFHPRPTRAAQFWHDEDLPNLLAGQDLEAGGTWLGVTREGRFAALTNIRAPGLAVGSRSRGRLVLDYLAGSEAPEPYLQRLAHEAQRYSGFNLLVGDISQLWHLNSLAGSPRPLRPGVYGLSNADLDTPWPKLNALREGLAAAPDGAPEQLLELLADPHPHPDAALPRTGVSLEWERMLSAAFIVGEQYGTRASSFLRLSAEGGVEFIERRFGPRGVSLGSDRWVWQLSATD